MDKWRDGHTVSSDVTLCKNWFVFMPRSKIRVVKDCQSWQNLNVFFEGTKWMDILTTPMTTSARTFVLQKNPFSTFCDNF